MSSPQEKQEMERIGSMLGKKSGLNPFARDLKQQGDDFMSLIQKGEVGAALGEVAPNSPFMQAYNIIAKLKEKFGLGKPDEEDIQNLLSVLMTAHRSGTMNANALRELWFNITGVGRDGDNEERQEFSKKLALQYEVYTPYHLLQQLVSVGNGLFGFPSNKGEVERVSTDIFKRTYPDLYRQRFVMDFGYEPPGMKSKGKKVSPSTAPTPSTPPPSGDELKLLGQIKAKLDGVDKLPSDPSGMAAMKTTIQTVLSDLQKVIDTMRSSAPTP